LAIRFQHPLYFCLEEILMLVPSPVRRVRNLHASSTIACALLFVTAAGVSVARAAEHTLMPSPKTVHIGYFLATVKPVLTIDSGDIVTIESAASVVPSVVISPASSRPAPSRNTSATSTAR
jgi:hypothetical protein